jgi:hypothetical protein
MRIMAAAKPTVDETGIFAFVTSLFGEDLHAKRILSLSQCTLGVIHAASLAIHSIGIGMAQARGVDPKHAIKQVDRMLSNDGISVWEIFRMWVPFAIGDRRQIVVTLDWTEHDHDDQATIAMNLVTSHGRATPLIWKSVVKSELKDHRNEYEDQVILRLHEVLPDGRRVTLLADRGFGDQKLYKILGELGFDFVIRFRESIRVANSDGQFGPASEWVPTNGRARMIRGAFVTQDKCPVPAVVCVKESGMMDNWCLATSRTDLSGKEVTALYGKRFTTEENFRDTKDLKYGLGLSATHIGSPQRRDRLLLIAALAQALLTLLGAAGEALGMDRLLKANTAKKRTHSLHRQGLYYYNAIPTMREDRLVPLMTKFAEIVRGQQICVEIFGLI